MVVHVLVVLVLAFGLLTKVELELVAEDEVDEVLMGGLDDAWAIVFAVGHAQVHWQCQSHLSRSGSL